MPKMQDGSLIAILDSKIQNSIGYQGGRLAADRTKAQSYYDGDPFGNEIDGRSKVVSRDVAEAIDAMMPPLMKIFTSGDQVVRFDPVGPEDEEAAKQATDYVNWIWTQQNEGFSIFYTWFKDALLKKNSVVKLWWDESIDIAKEEYEGLTDAEFQMMILDPDVELVEHTAYPDPTPVPQPPQMPGAPPMPAPPQAMLHDAVVRRTNKDGRVCIVPVPPDEFLIDRRAVDLDETPFCAHRVKLSVSKLSEMFPEKAETIRNLAPDDDGDFSQERLQRFKAEDEMPYREDTNIDPAMREVWVTECYIKVDYDGDGLAELRKVTMAGSMGSAGGVILENEEIDDNPFAAITPVPMPHKFFGMSIADQTQDLQLIKSTLWRGALDSVYLGNAPMVGAVEGQVNLDDLLNRRPGGVVRMKSVGALTPIPTVPVAADAYTMIAYVDNVREQRTGVQRFAPGPGADALNNAYTDTATGANIVESASQERLELIARTFAETGVKRAFRRTLELVCKHQNKPKIIRLRNKWVEMDPREWNNMMDLTVTVGLGTGNKTQQVAILSNLLNIDEKIVQLQGGVQGPLVTAKNIYAKLAKLVEASGLKSVEAYYTDPAEAPQQQPQQHQDPRMAQVQANAQAKMMQVQQEPMIERMRQEFQQQTQILLQHLKNAATIEAARISAGADLGAAAYQAEVDAASSAYGAHVNAQTQIQTQAMQPAPTQEGA
jgi:hypothetical protein